MSQRFDYFVIFAEMRTGSNFLEENVNSFSGLKCWGEIYNPKFIGKANKHEMHGIDLAARERDPIALLDKLRSKTDGLAGFRFFHDHDPRVLAHVLADPKCAKIILTRNPLESYVSRKIAAATGQWRLGDLKDARSAKVTFENEEFDMFLEQIKGFQLFLQNQLQTSGQTGFYINYQDIQDIEIVNGLARFLGVTDVHDKTVQKTKVQNPSALEDKVENYAEMVSALSSVDHFNLSSTPNFEPRRGPAVPTYVAGNKTPLLYLPLRGGPEVSIRAWLAALNGSDPTELMTSFNQKTLRQWKRQNKGHRSFTILPHPVARLHRVFCDHIVNISPKTYDAIRSTLRDTYKLPLPNQGDEASYTLEMHREAFIKFAEFVKGNLSGQTSVRVDGSWASQVEVLKGFSEFSLPEHILREDDLERDLPYITQSIGIDAPAAMREPEDTPYALQDIYCADVEDAVKAAYQKDYMMFGFSKWSAAG